jgi:hypothetical protein
MTPNNRIESVMKPKLFIVLFAALTVLRASAQLSVSAGDPKIAGQKAVVPLALKNDFHANIESARAAVFLLDQNGKIAGQATRWVIGGSHTNGLVAGATNIFNFVVQGTKAFETTNLTAKISFTRLVLEGGRAADPIKEVKMRP